MCDESVILELLTYFFFSWIISYSLYLPTV